MGRRQGEPAGRRAQRIQRELFNLKEDPTQTNDLAAQEPERLQQLQQLWMIEAVRNNVLPLNASQVAVLTVQRPGPAAGRKQFVYTTPNASNQFAVAPSIINRSYTITAEIEVPDGANGVLVNSRRDGSPATASISRTASRPSP